MKKRTAVFLTLSLILLINSSCTPTPPPPAPPPCPPLPLGVGDKRSIGSGDDSSIEVFANTYGYTDPGGVAWCNTSPQKLSITLADLNVLPTCQYNNCLAAVDIKPDNIIIQQPTGQSNGRPLLEYDLFVHSPNINPEGCTNTFCYAFYRFDNNNNAWLYSGSALAKQVSSKWFAEGRIFHLSIYALVELPPTVDLESPQNFGMIVASDFVENELGGLGVAFVVLRDDSGLVDPLNQELVFNFDRIDPAGYLGNPPAECLGQDNLAAEFTCSFPIGTSVEFTMGVEGDETLHRLSNLDQGYSLDFFSNPVQLHY